MPSALSETLTPSLSGLSAPRPSLAPSAVSGGFEDALRAADKPAPTPVAADRGPKPAKKDEDPPPSQAQDDSGKKDKDQDSDTAATTPVVPLVAVALAAPADAPATPAATETTDQAIPAIGAKATVPTPAPATPQTATPAPQEDGQAASFTQVLADAAAAKTAGANAATTDADAAGTGANATGGAATTQAGAAGTATANAAGAATTGTDDAAALANAGVSAVKGSLQPGATDATETDATAKTDAPAIPQAPAKPDATAAAKAEAKNDAAKAAVDATAAKKDAAADAADKLAHVDKADDGQKLPTAPLPGTDASARTTQATTATPAAQANPGQAQAQAPVPLAVVPNEIAARAAKGATKFDIRLDPADLGRIDVHIDIDSDGRVTSRLFVERSETLALLKNDSRQLERSLQQAGFQTDPGSLQFSLRDSGAGNTGGNAFARQNWTPPAPSQPTVRTSVQDETSRTALDALYRSSSRSSSGLDIRI